MGCHRRARACENSVGSCESEGEGRQLRAHTGTMWLCPFSTVPASPHEEEPGALKGPGSRGPRVRGLVKFAEAGSTHLSVQHCRSRKSQRPIGELQGPLSSVPQKTVAGQHVSESFGLCNKMHISAILSTCEVRLHLIGLSRT